MGRRIARSTQGVAAAGGRKPLATEHALQCSILEYLRLNARKDAYWFAVPNAGKRSLPVAIRMKAEGMTAGVADLCFMLPDGKCAWLELKRSPREKQTLEQIGFGDICDALGHPYVVVHSFDDAVHTLHRWGVLKPKGERI